MGLSVTFLRSSSPNHRSAAALTFTLSTPYRHHECNCLRKTETQIGSGVLCLRLGSLSDKSTFAQLPNFSPQSPKPFLPPSAPSVYVCACSCRLCYAFRFLGGPPSSPRQKTIGSSSRATRVNLCLLHLRNGGNIPHPPYRPLCTLYWPHCYHPSPVPPRKETTRHGKFFPAWRPIGFSFGWFCITFFLFACFHLVPSLVVRALFRSILSTAVGMCRAPRVRASSWAKSSLTWIGRTRVCNDLLYVSGTPWRHGTPKATRVLAQTFPLSCPPCSPLARSFFFCSSFIHRSSPFLEARRAGKENSHTIFPVLSACWWCCAHCQRRFSAPAYCVFVVCVSFFVLVSQ